MNESREADVYVDVLVLDDHLPQLLVDENLVAELLHHGQVKHVALVRAALNDFLEHGELLKVAQQLRVELLLAGELVGDKHLDAAGANDQMGDLVDDIKVLLQAHVEVGVWDDVMAINGALFLKLHVFEVGDAELAQLPRLRLELIQYVVEGSDEKKEVVTLEAQVQGLLRVNVVL